MTAIEDMTGDNRTPFLVGARDAYNISLCDEAYIAASRWANRVVYTGNLFIRTGKTQAENIANLETRLGALVNMKTSGSVRCSSNSSACERLTTPMSIIWMQG